MCNKRLWRACAEAGDLYQRDYEGLYYSGCEAFVVPGDLADGRCREHGEPPEPIVERNWFFRLSRYQDALLDLAESGGLRIEPEHRRNEVLAFVRRGLAPTARGTGTGGARARSSGADRCPRERARGRLGNLIAAGRVIADELRPFLPLGAERICAALAELDVRQGRTLVPKVEPVAS
jgi:tRNA synthetases class I (M)